MTPPGECNLAPTIGSKQEQTDGALGLCLLAGGNVRFSPLSSPPRDKLSAFSFQNPSILRKCSPGCLREPSGGLQLRRGRLVPMQARYVCLVKIVARVGSECLGYRLVSQRTPRGQRLRYVQGCLTVGIRGIDSRGQSVMTSRATLASATAAAVGSIAWYTHLYGSVPFLGEVHASHLSDEGLHPASYPWPHKGPLDSFDHAR